MKVCVTSKGKDLQSLVDPRFGRCSNFIIIETETMSFETINNESAGASGGAGIQSAQLISDKGASAVVTGNFGPNASSALLAAGIKMIIGAQGVSVAEALKNFQNGIYNEVTTASVESHFGMGSGRGMEKKMNSQTKSSETNSYRDHSSKDKTNIKLHNCNDHATHEEELEFVKCKINSIKKDFSSQIIVDTELCIGCGKCQSECPSKAISINTIAVIDDSLCTGCGLCIDGCPFEALAFS